MSFLQRIRSLGDSAAHRAAQRRTKVAADLGVLLAVTGLKRKDVAARLDISDAALSIRLNGTSNMTLESIGSICDAAGVEFDVVFRRKDDERARHFWENDDDYDIKVIKVDSGSFVPSTSHYVSKYYDQHYDLRIDLSPAYELIGDPYEPQSVAA